MPGEKTEQPTAKKLKEARKKGQVAKSQDLTQSVLFLVAIAALAAGGGAYVSELRAVMTDLFQPQMLTGTLPDDELIRRTGQAWSRGLIPLLPLLACVFAAAAAMNFLQVKALFSLEIIKPKLEKIDPLKGFQNKFFKARTYLELLKTAVKFAVIFAIAYAALKASMRDVLLTVRADPVSAGHVASRLMFGLLFRAGMVFVVIGAADFFLQKKMHLKSLMMSKYEVQKEYKEDEGDPHIKHLRKQLHEQMISNDVAARVPRAAAVVVNPTHIAVAIEYDEGSMNAPVVSAKGKMELAERIKALARKHRVPVVRQVPLARSLYEVDVGGEIPEELYGAVAEVLNWVYTLAQQENAEEAI
jgi:flagellar biosynthesis protein FlhB